MEAFFYKSTRTQILSMILKVILLLEEYGGEIRPNRDAQKRMSTGETKSGSVQYSVD